MAKLLYLKMPDDYALQQEDYEVKFKVQSVINFRCF